MLLRQDVLTGLLPDERLGSHMIVKEVLAKRLNELSNAAENSAANASLQQRAEQAFDRVERRTRRWTEVQMEVGMPPNPSAYGLILVRREVSQDQMPSSHRDLN